MISPNNYGMIENFSFNLDSAYAKFRNGLLLEWKSKTKIFVKNLEFLNLKQIPKKFIGL